MTLTIPQRKALRQCSFACDVFLFKFERAIKRNEDRVQMMLDGVEIRIITKVFEDAGYEVFSDPETYTKRLITVLIPKIHYERTSNLVSANAKINKAFHIVKQKYEPSNKSLWGAVSEYIMHDEHARNLTDKEIQEMFSLTKYIELGGYK